MLWRALIILALLAGTAGAQPVLSGGWRPPSGCSADQFLKFNGSAWVCGTANAFSTSNAIPKGNGSGLTASSWTDNGSTSTTTGALQVNGLVTGLASLHLDTSTSNLVGPELDYIGYNGEWFMGIDVANPATSRDLVLVGLRGTYSCEDAIVTSGSPTITSAAQCGFSSTIVGKAISGTGIPGGTTILSVTDANTATLSANATSSGTIRATVTNADNADIVYLKHRGGRHPTFGVGITPPSGNYRFEISAADVEPAMGTFAVRVGPSQTGKAFNVYDSGATDRLWVTSDFYLSGNHVGGGSAIAIQAEAVNQRPLSMFKNDKTTAYGFQYSGNSMAFRYHTGGVTAWTVNTSGNLTVNTNLSVTGTSGLTGLLTATAGGTTPANWTTTGTGDLVSADDLTVADDATITDTLTIGAVTIRAGTGTPEGAVTAPVGSLYLRTDGGANTTLYVKESGAGNTGWIAK